MKVGYARVTTTDQNPQLQVDALRDAGCDEIVEEHASGKNRQRPVLEADTRQAEQGRHARRVEARPPRPLRHRPRRDHRRAGRARRRLLLAHRRHRHQQRQHLTATLVRQILAAVAQFERGIIRERVSNGVAAAKRNGTKSGKPFGRPPRITRQDEDEILEAWEPTPVARLAQRYKVDEVTIYRAYKRAKARQSAT